MRKILIVIDMQNDFIDGVLGSKAAQNIVPKVCEKIRNFKGKDIIYTIDEHLDSSYIESIEGQRILRHCIEKTNGWHLNEEVQKALDDYDGVPEERLVYGITKQTFGSTHSLPHYIFELVNMYKLQRFSDFEIEIVGLCTDICVISNALILRSTFPWTKITIDSKCCAGSTPENHNAALKIMEANCIDII